MRSHSNRDPNNMIQALVVTSQKVVDLMGKDLSGHFVNYKVSLVEIAPAGAGYGPGAIALILSGKQEDIKKSLNQLKKICYEKEIGIEKTPIRSLPPVLEGYLSDMENDIRFEKIFDYCSKEYLNHCKLHNVKPHPEVVEITNNI